jgi:hypothetical protein
MRELKFHGRSRFRAYSVRPQGKKPIPHPGMHCRATTPKHFPDVACLSGTGWKHFNLSPLPGTDLNQVSPLFSGSCGWPDIFCVGRAAADGTSPMAGNERRFRLLAPM